MGPRWNTKDAARLFEGNACMIATLDIIRHCMKHRVPWVLEHPSTSKAWYLPEVLFGEAHPDVICSIADFCQYGSRWRKRTKFMSAFIDQQDLHRVAHKCQGHGKCSRTGKPHLQLTGQSPQGVAWTKIAQPYPGRLCHSLAHALTSHARL